MRRLCLFLILLAAWPKAVQAGDQTYTITAAITGWEIAPGFRVQAYTYNGTVPGPELRGIVGDTFRITLINRLPVATSIHWHGLAVPNGMDGVPGIGAPAVLPGETFTYIFTVTSPGTYWYHPHANSAAQIARGLYGLLIVEPNIRPEYDREVSLVIGEYGLATMGGGMASGTLLINGKTGPAIPDIRVRRGEKILFRMVNTGNMVHPMHVHGLHWLVTATDGFDLASPYRKDTLPLNAGERYDTVLEADNPGIWMIHCHNLLHVGDNMAGLAFIVIVE